MGNKKGSVNRINAQTLKKQNKQKKIRCAYCNIEYWEYLHEINRSINNFCSTECFVKYAGKDEHLNKELKQCANIFCENTFYDYKVHKRKYCSYKCSNYIGSNDYKMKLMLQEQSKKEEKKYYKPKTN